MGFPTCNSDIRLIDEEGNVSDEGQLCIHLPYFRGYRNLPEENIRTHTTIDHKEFFCSGDLAKRDDKGRIVILGRVDDMVNINGNRVEPAEIQNAVKAVTGADSCVVKPFIRNGIPLLFVYYIGVSEINPAEVSLKLHEYLPDYMMPSRYIRLESMPLNANGKVDKLALPEPDFETIYRKMM